MVYAKAGAEIEKNNENCNLIVKVTSESSLDAKSQGVIVHWLCHEPCLNIADVNIMAELYTT